MGWCEISGNHNWFQLSFCSLCRLLLSVCISLSHVWLQVQLWRENCYQAGIWLLFEGGRKCSCEWLLSPLGQAGSPMLAPWLSAEPEPKAAVVTRLQGHNHKPVFRGARIFVLSSVPTNLLLKLVQAPLLLPMDNEEKQVHWDGGGGCLSKAVGGLTLKKVRTVMICLGYLTNFFKEASQPSLIGVRPSFCQCQTWQWSPFVFLVVQGTCILW